MAQIVSWIVIGTISAVILGFGLTAIGLSYWDDIQQRRERRQRLGNS